MVGENRTAVKRFQNLENCILDRDQVGASTVVHELLRDGIKADEILSDTIRIHAPYTHVPYHQRVDNGFLRFVNNDHCLLSASATVRLRRFMPKQFIDLPLAQTVWYVPTGLDIWGQLEGRMPGHYVKRGEKKAWEGPVPVPECHREDQEPIYLEGTIEEKLNTWLALVQRGEVEKSYSVFLGIFEETEHRTALLSQLVFAGLIDVQARMFNNRSFSTGHKAYRARATIELGRTFEWDKARHVLYAGVLDMAVGPQWYSTYEMACQVALNQLTKSPPKSSLAPTPSDMDDDKFMANDAPLSNLESESLIRAILEGPEKIFVEEITSLLKMGKAPRNILDAIQIASARTILSTGYADGFSMPHHGYEYTNTLRWFFDNFDHKHSIKLLYIAGSFIHQVSQYVLHTPDNGERFPSAPIGSENLTQQKILANLDRAMVDLNPEESLAWTQAYLGNSYSRRPLVEILALGSAKQGNDPHNQEVGLCLLEDFVHSTSPNRDALLLACAWHTAGHRKYGDTLEPYRRFAAAVGIETAEESEGDGDILDAMLDDVEVTYVENGSG